MEEEEDGLKFDKFVLPFTDFRLTAYGRERENTRELDDKIKIQSIGLTLAGWPEWRLIFDLGTDSSSQYARGSSLEGHTNTATRKE
jgi:hypothetical protein